jgi:hypothetical protein
MASIQNGGAGRGRGHGNGNDPPGGRKAPPPKQVSKALGAALQHAGVGPDFIWCLTCLQPQTAAHRADWMNCRNCHEHGARHRGDPCPMMRSMNTEFWVARTGMSRDEVYGRSKSGPIHKDSRRRQKEAMRQQQADGPSTRSSHPATGPSSHSFHPLGGPASDSSFRAADRPSYDSFDHRPYPYSSRPAGGYYDRPPPSDYDARDRPPPGSFDRYDRPPLGYHGYGGFAPRSYYQQGFGQPPPGDDYSRFPRSPYEGYGNFSPPRPSNLGPRNPPGHGYVPGSHSLGPAPQPEGRASRRRRRANDNRSAIEILRAHQETHAARAAGGMDLVQVPVQQPAVVQIPTTPSVVRVGNPVAEDTVRAADLEARTQAQDAQHASQEISGRMDELMTEIQQILLERTRVIRPTRDCGSARPIEE